MAWRGAASFLADGAGPLHPCCRSWRKVLEAGRPCPACEVARVVLHGRRLPGNPRPLPALIPGTDQPMIPEED